MKESGPESDQHHERILTREQAHRHLSKVLEVGGRYNPTSEEADFEYIPNSNDLAVLFRSDSGEYARMTDPYTKFLNQYNLEPGEKSWIPSHKLKISELKGWPCIMVRTLE